MCAKHVNEVINTSSLGLYMIDLPLPLPGFSYQITSWLLQDRVRGKNFLVDIGPASTVPSLEKSLSSLGVDKLDYILLTHVHLDHAGGMGHLSRSFPDAKIVVPLKGRKHLLDPERLWKGSLSTLGDMVLTFGEMEAIGEDIILPDGIHLDNLEIWNTPGHASHHQSFLYECEEEKILFPGEAAGVMLNRAMASRWLADPDSADGSIPESPVPSVPDVLYMYPASPPVFDLDITRASLESIMARESTIICYSHYGFSRFPSPLLQLHMEQLTLWEEVIRGVLKSGDTLEVVLEKARTLLLASDGFLSCYRFFNQEMKEKESFFIKNSILGFAGFLKDKD